MKTAAAVRAAIERIKQKVETAQHALDLAQAELRGAEAVARLMRDESAAEPAEQAAPNTPPAGKNGAGRRGRIFGALSDEWCAILARMHARYPEGATDRQIAEIGHELGRPNLRPHKARVRVESYMRTGFIERSGDAFRVTPQALEYLEQRGAER
jgi:hypothetical protein